MPRLDHTKTDHLDHARVSYLIGSHHNVPGAWSGTGYGYHPHGIYRAPFIFTDHHNVSGSWDIQICLDPESAMVWPPNDADASRVGSKAAADLRPRTGGTLCVNRSGEWVERGPWEEKIKAILNQIEDEVEALEKEAARIEREKQEALAASHQELLRRATLAVGA